MTVAILRVTVPLGACLTAVVVVLYGRGYVSYDSAYALSWGADLAAGRRPGYDVSLPPAPHPLTIGLGALLSPLGGDALEVGGWLASGSIGALGTVAFLLGRRLGGVPTGLVAAALTLTRAPVLLWGSLGYLDVGYTALVAAAVLAWLHDPGRPRPALALLLVAGLLRPEAWLLAGGVVAVAWWRSGRRPPPFPEVALALAAPAAWLLFDLLTTGEPLYSFTSTREAGAGGRGAEVGESASNLLAVGAEAVRTARPTVVAGAALAVVLGWRLRDRPVGIVTLWCAAAGGVAAAVVLAGGAVLERFLLLVVVLACVLCAWAITGLLRPERWARATGGLALVVVLAGLPSEQGRRADDAGKVQAERARIAALEALAAGPEARGTPLAVPGRVAPWISLWRDEPAERVLRAPKPGTYTLTPTADPLAAQVAGTNGDYRSGQWTGYSARRSNAFWTLRLVR